VGGRLEDRVYGPLGTGDTWIVLAERQAVPKSGSLLTPWAREPIESQMLTDSRLVYEALQPTAVGSLMVDGSRKGYADLKDL
jgi:hypothetical protein